MDRALLLWLNRLDGAALDRIMLVASNRLLLLGVACCAVIFVLLRRGSARPAAVLLIAAISFTALLGTYVVKPLSARTRPCWTEPVRTIVGCGSNESMPSNHAATAAAGAVVLVWAAPAAAVIAVPLALLVGVSRVYFGVHYPSDVLAGWLLGVAVALLTLGGGHLVRIVPASPR